MRTGVMFLDCPAYMDQHGTVRCGLPAAVESRYAVSSTDGPLDSAKIRCPRGHWFNAPIEALTGQIMFLECPAFLDAERTARCGLPAEVRHRFLLDSTEGPLEGAAIRCPSDHFFNGPIESLTFDKKPSAGGCAASGPQAPASGRYPP